MKQYDYIKRIETANGKLNILLKKSGKLSNLRLIVFVGLLLSFLVFLIKNNYLYLILVFIIFGLFIYLVIIHNKVAKEVYYYRLLLDVLGEYISRFNKNWINFNETGLDYKNNDLPFLEDLDIIGDTSLFKYLNVCVTKDGKNKLIKRLSNLEMEEDELIKRQKAMSEVAKNVDFSLDFQVALRNYKNEGANTNLKYISKNLQNKYEFSNLYIYTSIILTIGVILTIIFASLSLVSWIYFGVTFFIQFIFSSVCRYKYKEIFSRLSNIFLTLVMLDNVYDVIKKTDFTDDVLVGLQNDIKNYGIIGINKISKVKDIESYNKFFLTNFIFNGLFSINVLIINSYIKFIDKYGIYFYKSIAALEEFEVYTSLGILGQTKENICMPTLSEEIKIDFDDLQHPLISESECIANSFLKEANLNIITGSNMSGKTSFLRTIGINIVLMNAGAYCNAKSFSAPYLKIFTSMRIADDISKGISTFYAELLRMKLAIEYAKENKPMIVFIDEIFKGTNANDRIFGAISLIEKLNKDYIIIFISTHDFELCDISSVRVNNYHFSEHYEEEKIKFDYKLKKGKCYTTNARYLMKIAGIIDK